MGYPFWLLASRRICICPLHFSPRFCSWASHSCLGRHLVELLSRLAHRECIWRRSKDHQRRHSWCRERSLFLYRSDPVQDSWICPRCLKRQPCGPPQSSEWLQSWDIAPHVSRRGEQELHHWELFSHHSRICDLLGRISSCNLSIFALRVRSFREFYGT